MTRLIEPIRVIALSLSFSCITASFFLRHSGNDGIVLSACGGLLLILSMVAGVFSPKEKHLSSEPARSRVLVLCSISAFFAIASLILSQL